MDPQQFRQAGYQTIDWICNYFDTLETGNVMPSVNPSDVGRQIPANAPVHGESWKAVAADFDKIIMPGMTHWQHPSFFAFFPGNTTFESILAELLIATVSNPGFNWLCSPACTELEVAMMDWCASMLGLDAGFHNSSQQGGGVIMSSATESFLTICVAARERVMRLFPGTKLEDLVIVATSQTHSMGAKIAIVLGLKFHAIQTHAKDEWGLRGEDLERALIDLKADGKVPFILLATIGSTSTGAIDNLAEITAVTAKFPEVYLHVDAAWAGVFLALPEARTQCHLDAINAPALGLQDAVNSGQVHSMATSLHKTGLVTLDATLLFIRDRRVLNEALDITPPFLRNAVSDSGLVIDYRNWQLALGRRFRSLKIWFVLRSYGVEGFQAHLRKNIALADRLVQHVVDDPQRTFELFVKRRFSLVVLRLKARYANEDEEALNKAFFARMSERKDIHLTPTTVGGKHCTRIAVGSMLVRDEHIDSAWLVIKEVAAQTLAEQLKISPGKNSDEVASAAPRMRFIKTNGTHSH